MPLSICCTGSWVIGGGTTDMLRCFPLGGTACGWLSTAPIGLVFGRGEVAEEDEAVFEECTGAATT